MAFIKTEMKDNEADARQEIGRHLLARRSLFHNECLEAPPENAG